MKKNIGLGLAVIGTFVCVSFFQNCSKIIPQDLLQKTGEAKVTSAGDPTNVVNNDTIVEITATDESPVVGPVNVIATADKKCKKKKEEVAGLKDDDDNDDNQDKDKYNKEVIGLKNDDDKDENNDDDNDNDEIVEVKHDDNECDKDNEEVAEVEDDNDDDDSAAIAACLDKNFRSSLTGSVFSNLDGKHEIVSNQIDEISNNHGKFIVRSPTADSLVSKISNNRGKIILCNMNVDLIEEGRGKLVLINSHVKEISSHKGKVKSIHSTIEKFSGRLKVVAF